MLLFSHKTIMFCFKWHSQNVDLVIRNIIFFSEFYFVISILKTPILNYFCSLLYDVHPSYTYNPTSHTSLHKHTYRSPNRISYRTISLCVFVANITVSRNYLSMFLAALARPSATSSLITSLHFLTFIPTYDCR